MSAVRAVTDATFDAEVLGASASKPVVVDFWATWCGPCKQVAPVLDAYAAEKGDTVEVVKVDIDDAPGLAKRYNIMSVPTILVFSDGQVVKEVIGAKPRPVLVRELDSAL